MPYGTGDEFRNNIKPVNPTTKLNYIYY